MVMIENFTTVVLFRPLTESSCEWLKEKVPADTVWYGDSLEVKQRYADALTDKLILEGYTVSYA